MNVFYSLIDVEESWRSIADLSDHLKELEEENSKHSKVFICVWGWQTWYFSDICLIYGMRYDIIAALCIH